MKEILRTIYNTIKKVTSNHTLSKTFYILIGAGLTILTTYLTNKQLHDNANGLWKRNQQYVINKQMIESRIDLYIDATKLFNRLNLLSTYRNQHKIYKSAIQKLVKTPNFDVKSLNDYSKNVSDYMNKYTEIHSDVASILSSTSVYFGPGTLSAIDTILSIQRIPSDSLWFERDPTLVYGLLDSMRNEINYNANMDDVWE